MVGIFSRFSVSKANHRRTQSALDERDILPRNSEATGAVSLSTATSSAAHGIDIALEFKPLERPIEPLDNDQPIQCPLPEPSILNDGRIWKERVSAGAQRRPSEMPVMQEGGGTAEPETAGSKQQPPPRRVILPSISAPEHSILKLLEESGI